MKPGAVTAGARAANAYRKSGVDIGSADRWLARMKPFIRSTGRPEVLPDRGQFAGFFRFNKANFRDPVLVASTDGVGTKLKVAQLVRRHAGIGIDAVAMNTNDILTCGAEPLFFLDYLAVGRMQSAIMSVLVKGIAFGCRQSGCALIGGETAEMPGVYEDGEYDVAGFCVGVVDKPKLIDGSRARAGDAILGLASSGVHANGFSLVRKVFSRQELKKHAKELLTPTRIYVKPVLAALRRFPILAITHVTGGGMSRRMPALAQGRPGLRAQLFEDSWKVPGIFQRIQAAGSLSDAAMSETFNMGVGLALVCRKDAVTPLIRHFTKARIPAWQIGRLERLP